MRTTHTAEKRLLKFKKSERCSETHSVDVSCVVPMSQCCLFSLFIEGGIHKTQHRAKMVNYWHGVSFRYRRGPVSSYKMHMLRTTGLVCVYVCVRTHQSLFMCRENSQLRSGSNVKRRRCGKWRKTKFGSQIVWGTWCFQGSLQWDKERKGTTAAGADVLWCRLARLCG